MAVRLRDMPKIRTGAAAKIYKVANSTLRKRCDKGEVPFKWNDGHRIFEEAKIREHAADLKETEKMRAKTHSIAGAAKNLKTHSRKVSAMLKNKELEETQVGDETRIDKAEVSRKAKEIRYTIDMSEFAKKVGVSWDTLSRFLEESRKLEESGKIKQGWIKYVFFGGKIRIKTREIKPVKRYFDRIKKARAATYSLKGAASYLKVSRSKLENMCNRGKLEYRVFGKEIRLDSELVEKIKTRLDKIKKEQKGTVGTTIAADILNVSEGTIDYMCKDGRLRYKTVDGEKRIFRSQLSGSIKYRRYKITPKRRKQILRRNSALIEFLGFIGDPHLFEKYLDMRYSERQVQILCDHIIQKRF